MLENPKEIQEIRELNRRPLNQAALKWMREAEKLERELPEAEREAWVAEYPVWVQGSGRTMVEYQLHAVTFLQWAIRQPIVENQEEREQLDVEARTFEESRTPAEQLKYLTTFRGEGNQPTRLAQRLTGDDTGTERVEDNGDVRTPTDDGRGEDVGSTPDEAGTELGGATDAASDTTTEPAAEDTVVEEEQRRRDEEKAAEIARPYVALTDAMKSGLKALYPSPLCAYQ